MLIVPASMEDATLSAIMGIIILVSYLQVMPLQLIRR